MPRTSTGRRIRSAWPPEVTTRSLLADTLLTGAVAAIATFAVPGLLRAARGESVAASLNAESHVLWGDSAAEHDDLSVRYTGVGAATHLGACLFWSGLYEAAMGDVSATRPADDYAGAAATAASAYLIDYHLIPKRFTPGFEMRYSAGDMAAFFATLVAVMPLRRLLARRSRSVGRWSGRRQPRAPTARGFANPLPYAA